MTTGQSRGGIRSRTNQDPEIHHLMIKTGPLVISGEELLRPDIFERVVKIIQKETEFVEQN